MKNLLALLFILGTLSAGAQASVILSLTADSENVFLGDDIVLNVKASTTGTSAFTSFGLDIFMNNNQLLGTDMVLAITSPFNSFLSADGDGFAGKLPEPELIITPNGPFFMPFALSGKDIPLATITLSNLVEGTYDFQLGVTMDDPSEGIFNADFSSGPPGLVQIDQRSFGITSVTVAQAVNAPSVALLMSVLAGMLVLRRKV